MKFLGKKGHSAKKIQYLLQYVPLCGIVAPYVGNKKRGGKKIYIPIVFCVWPVQEAGEVIIEDKKWKKAT